MKKFVRGQHADPCSLAFPSGRSPVLGTLLALESQILMRFFTRWSEVRLRGVPFLIASMMVFIDTGPDPDPDWRG